MNDNYKIQLDKASTFECNVKIEGASLNKTKANLIVKSDPIFKFKGSVRSLIRHSFKRNGFKKNSRTFNIIGCSFEEFHSHIINQFKPGMTIENHGILWHIDHIKPLSLATTYDEIIQLNHYTNLQPLWATTEIARANGDLISIGNLEKSDN